MVSSKSELHQLGHRPLAVDALLFRSLDSVDAEMGILIVLVVEEEAVLSVAPCCWSHYLLLWASFRLESVALVDTL